MYRRMAYEVHLIQAMRRIKLRYSTMSKTSPKNGLKRPKVVFSENDEQQLVKDSFLGSVEIGCTFKKHV